MTRYTLWKKARAHHKGLSESAVYEYLRGARDLGIASVEALMKAANLKVVPQKTNFEAPRKAASPKGVPQSKPPLEKATARPAVVFVGAGMASAKAKAVRPKAAKATVRRPKHSSKA
jgi:hypothetical protein